MIFIRGRRFTKMKNIQGLTSAEARKSAQTNGKNSLTQKKKKTFFQTYWENYDDPIIMVLLVALGINIAFTFTGKVDWHECAGILLSVIISTFVSAMSEYSNENTFRKLQQEAARTVCKVWRDGELCEIPVSDIVVGDMVLLQAGDIIPADGRIADGRIMVDQSPLSGESKEAEKYADERISQKSAFNDFWNRHNLFRGSMVCSGEAVMLVDVVGDETVYGRLTREAQEEGRESPLAVKLAGLAKSISKFGCISAAAIVIISFLNDAFIAQSFDPMLISNYFSDIAQVTSDLISSLIIGIIVIVVAVPEGLPLMIAIVCSLNMKKMLKANVLVRKLVGIETAGGINILFTDKTGTITRGKPQVEKFIDGTGSEYSSFAELGERLGRMFEISVAANTAARFSGEKIIGGNATEKALLEFAGRRNVTLRGVSEKWTVPFSSDKKYSMACIEDEKPMTLVKGAPELIVPRCGYCYSANGDRVRIAGAKLDGLMQSAAKSAMRLIAIAAADGNRGKEGIPGEMTLIGVAAIRDAVRPEARAAIADVTRAGIQVVMITGDRAETAVAIAQDAGLMFDGDVVLTSSEVSAMSDDELREILPKLRVVARAIPTDKSRLVRIAQSMNRVVGMTGDGVNDAPALKLADVGFAMGGGAEAAAAAADIVILDDNFRSVRNAVLYGRTIYKSIKKFIQFQLTINVAAVTVSMLGPIVGIEKPLDISQMIWTNLMIDSLAAIAFGGEAALNKYMNEKPRRRDENIIDRKMWSAIITDGLYICALSLLFFIAPAIQNLFRGGSGSIYFYTGYFTFFIFISIFNAFNARCDGIDLFENLALNKQFLTVMCGIAAVQILMTYFGGSLLRTAGLMPNEWIAVIMLALTVFPIDLIRKIIIGKRSE